MLHIFCLCVCARARACLHIRVCGYLGAWECACACVHVALLIQYVIRMNHIVTSFVACVSATFSHKRHIFGKKL
jgi:hypothetical protein